MNWLNFPCFGLQVINPNGAPKLTFDVLGVLLVLYMCVELPFKVRGDACFLEGRVLFTFQSRLEVLEL